MKPKRKQQLVVRELPASYGAQAEDVEIALLRRLGPAERLAQAFELFDFTWHQIENFLRVRHPRWSKRKIHEEVRRRMQTIR